MQINRKGGSLTFSLLESCLFPSCQVSLRKDSHFPHFSTFRNTPRQEEHGNHETLHFACFLNNLRYIYDYFML